jgi:choline dehydrogenase
MYERTRYDYVIVGAGSAGCVLANRLTEDPDTTVLVLEAGGSDNRQEIRIPVAFPKLFKGPCDWAYETEEQSQLGRRTLYWPRGKILGGSSSMNAMIYIRGNRSDYDHWRSVGNEGWGYEDALPYFKKAENRERGADAYHGTGGPLNVADLRYVNPVSRAFVEAADEIGLPRNDDFNGEEQEGVGTYQVTQRKGRRHSAADAYLRPAIKRSNLTVQTGARANRLFFEGTRAVGVEYVRGGRLERTYVDGEVILSGGAINSPQLLMLSGIGPADGLRALDIPVTHDLPGVGRNLQDHPMIAVAYECRAPVTLDEAETRGNLARYLLSKRGPLASNIAEAGGFVRIDPAAHAPDLQFHFLPCYFLDNGFKNPRGCGFTFGPTLLRPRSRGHITLRSGDPSRPPAIQPNYLDDEPDLRLLVEGVKLARRLAQTAAFDPFRGKEVWPGTKAQSDEAIAGHIRRNVQTLYHPVGTCKMGDDPMAVVDDRLRVRGTEGLRVVDASIMPNIVSGNTNAPTIMIAEKAADMIKQDTPDIGPAGASRDEQGIRR